MTFTDVIQGNKLVTVVGESPSNPPNCYTDVSIFLTPNAKIELWISTKQQFAIDKNKKEGLIQPDIKCEADVAFDKVKETIKEE